MRSSHTAGDVATQISAATWLSLSAFVIADPGFAQTTLVLNPVSEVLVEVFGPDVGCHSRTAPGVAALPFNLPVILAAELEITP